MSNSALVRPDDSDRDHRVLTGSITMKDAVALTVVGADLSLPRPALGGRLRVDELSELFLLRRGVPPNLPKAWRADL